MGPKTNGGKEKASKKKVKQVKRPQPRTYELFVRDGVIVPEGVRCGKYPAGKKVKIEPIVREGMVFRRWSSYPVGIVDNLVSATTVVTIPAKRLVVKAFFDPEVAASAATSSEPSAEVPPTEPPDQGG